MKKLLLVLITCFCFASCKDIDSFSGPFTITNNSDKVCTVLYSAKNYDEKIEVIPAKKTFTTDIYYYNPSVKVIKDSTNKNILDNKFTCKADGFTYYISENKLTELIIVNKIPEGKLDPTHKLYFHSNNKCFEYSNSPDVLYRTDLYKLPVYKTASLSIIEKDASGKKINSDIYLEIIDNKLFLY